MRMTAIPTRDGSVRLADGRRMAFAEWGDLEGRPVILLHGMPGSRLVCPDEDATKAAGVRLITIDRPGYGGSDPAPGRSLRSWVGDLAGFAALTGLPPCPVIGWSSGGPYAMACAATAPGLVTSIALAASNGPLDEVPGAWDALSDAARDLVGLLRLDRAAAIDRLTPRLQWYADDPLSMFADDDEPAMPAVDMDADRAMRREPDVRQAMRASMREGARQGSIGFVEDWAAECEPWGFSVASVAVPTSIWWGERDGFVPRADADYLARTIPGASLTTYPDDGHGVPVRHWREILGALT